MGRKEREIEGLVGQNKNAESATDQSEAVRKHRKKFVL